VVDDSGSYNCSRGSFVIITFGTFIAIAIGAISGAAIGGMLSGMDSFMAMVGAILPGGSFSSLGGMFGNKESASVIKTTEDKA